MAGVYFKAFLALTFAMALLITSADDKDGVAALGFSAAATTFGLAATADTTGDFFTATVSTLGLGTSATTACTGAAVGTVSIYIVDSFAYWAFCRLYASFLAALLFNFYKTKLIGVFLGKSVFKALGVVVSTAAVTALLDCFGCCWGACSFGSGFTGLVTIGGLGAGEAALVSGDATARTGAGSGKGSG